MPSKDSDHHTWTLRFKNHKTTILLLVQSTQSFESIKQELLKSLKAAGKTQINGVSLPSSQEDIVLGVPIDKNDPTQGWVELEIQETEASGKKSRGNSAKDFSILNENPVAAGLQDNAVLAFKFGDDTEGWDVIMPSYEDEEVA